MQDKRIQEVLNDYKWSPQDTYSLTIFHFESAPGWDPHIYTVYSFLILEMEKNWYNACALSLDNKLVLIYNHTRDTHSSSYDAYLQSVAYFVRDNMCKAGIAPLFTDFTHLYQAKMAAEIALEMGMKIQPHLWYYLYEDYRLAYMLHNIKLSAKDDLLYNPQIAILMKYDQNHDGELTKTLKTYLECNMNMTTAAKKLYIHRTSFCRRMNHIQELTGLDYENPDVVLDLLLSFRILENKGI